MEAKLCLVLMLIILGTLFTVQGAIPRNREKNPLEVFARLPRECFFGPLMTIVCFYNFFLTAYC